jgi:hypothetical protein
VATLDAVLNFVHNLGDFILLVLSLPFSAAVSWWYGPPTDEDQAGLTEADSESVRSFGDEQPAGFKRRSDHLGYRNLRISPTAGDALRSGAATENGLNTYPHGVSWEIRNSSDTLRSRFYAAPDTSSQNHQIWYPPPSSHEDPDEDQADNPANVPPIAMPEPGIPSIGTDDWRTYPPFPSAYPPTPVGPPQISMPEPIHPSQFGVIHEEGARATVPNNDQTDGARQGFGRSLLPPREPSNPGSDGDLSDENENPGVQIQEIRYVTSSDSDEDMEDYETEEDSFDITFRTPQHRRILRAVPMGREVSNVSIVTEATVASSAPSETTGLTTDHHASSLRTATVTMSRSASMATSSAAGMKRPLPHYKIGVRPRIRVADNRSPRKVGATRGTGRFTAIPRPASVWPTRGGTVSEDTLDDEDLKDGKDALARKKRRVTATPKTRRMVASRPVGRGARDVSQSSESRPGQDSKKTRVARISVATKTSLRSVNPRGTVAAAGSSGSTICPRKTHQAVKRAGAPFRP